MSTAGSRRWKAAGLARPRAARAPRDLPVPQGDDRAELPGRVRPAEGRQVPRGDRRLQAVPDDVPDQRAGGQRAVLARRGALRHEGSIPTRCATSARCSRSIRTRARSPDALLKIGYCKYELKNWPKRAPRSARSCSASPIRRLPVSRASGSRRWMGKEGEQWALRRHRRRRLLSRQRLPGSRSPRSSSRSRARPTPSAGPPSSCASPAARCAASTATRSTRSTAASGSVSMTFSARSRRSRRATCA